MIIGIGIDIVEISRIKKLMENEHAIERLLTPADVITSYSIHYTKLYDFCSA